MTTEIFLIEHETGESHPAAFDVVRGLGDGAVSGIARMSLGAHGDFTVPVVLHGERVFAYHDWQQGEDSARTVAGEPETFGRWFDNETDKPAIWLDGRPHVLA